MVQVRSGQPTHTGRPVGWRALRGPSSGDRVPRPRRTGTVGGAAPRRREGTPLRLQSTDAAPGRAREWLRRTCRTVDGDVLDDAVLLVSELVTNARRHAGGMITVAAECGPHGLAVAVVDDSPVEPVRVDAGPLADSGRGLLVVDAVADSWGCRRLTQGSGKAVWFRVAPNRRPRPSDSCGRRSAA